MNRIWVCHPTGNSFVRALLHGLAGARWDYQYYTTVALSSEQRWLQALPQFARSELARRTYDVPPDRLFLHPLREVVRLAAERLAGPAAKTAPAISIDAVYSALDRAVAESLRESPAPPKIVYGYEDGSLEMFQAAAARGTQCVYELPIAYWETARRILLEEAARLPDWEPTLGATRDGEEKLARKSRELELAHCVVCPSQFVLDSLPAHIRAGKSCVAVPFGSPIAPPRLREVNRKLRVLFAGQMTQRKGLADLLAAFQLLERTDVELVILGSPLLPMEFYRSRFPGFRYESPRSHAEVLELMNQCDLLALPSLVEGRALVLQEALACGLPLITTAHAGGVDLVEEGRTGFLVPIRSPVEIAAKIDWFATHRDQLPSMREACRAKAASHTWEQYASTILEFIVQN